MSIRILERVGLGRSGRIGGLMVLGATIEDVGRFPINGGHAAVGTSKLYVSCQEDFVAGLLPEGETYAR